MPRPAPTDGDIELRKRRAQEMKHFMKEHLFTEIKLADVLGVSRRTVQMIKAGKVTPTPSTLHKWEALLKSHGHKPSLLQDA